MSPIERPFALILAAGTLISVGPLPQSYHRAMIPAHKGAMHSPGAHSMRAMIMASAAVVQQNEIAAAPLYDGLGKVHFQSPQPMPWRSAISTRAWVSPTASITWPLSLRSVKRSGSTPLARSASGEKRSHTAQHQRGDGPAANARAVGLARYADWLARQATPEERALTAAMVRRYSPDPGADRAALDAAYADAMLAAALARIRERHHHPDCREIGHGHPGLGTIGRPTSNPTRASPRRCDWSKPSWPEIPSTRRPRISTST